MLQGFRIYIIDICLLKCVKLLQYKCYFLSVQIKFHVYMVYCLHFVFGTTVSGVLCDKMHVHKIIKWTKCVSDPFRILYIFLKIPKYVHSINIKEVFPRFYKNIFKL